MSKEKRFVFVKRFYIFAKNEKEAKKKIDNLSETDLKLHSENKFELLEKSRSYNK